MFFMTLMIVFMLIGTILAMPDIVFPGFFIYEVGIMVRWTGIILMWVGAGLYLGRVIKTGGDKFANLPEPSSAKLIHVGKSSAKILNAKKTEPNRLRAKGVGQSGHMNIKDTGDAINIAGHDVFITTQDDGYNIPLWVCDLVDKWQKRYLFRKEKEWREVHKALQNIKDTDSQIVIESKLNDIKLLKPVMADAQKKQDLLFMKPRDLRHMTETVIHGRVVNAKAYLDWAEGATPYDNEAIIYSTVSRLRSQDAGLKHLGGVNWLPILISMMVILILGAIAYQIFGG